MLKIHGGHSLSGTVSISGSKNASAPIIAAALLFQKATLHNVPRIGDIFNFLEIVKSLGVQCDFVGNTLHLAWSRPNYAGLDKDLMKKIRISIFLLPALLRHFEKAAMPFPGGCNLGKRPIDEHIDGLIALGYTEGVEDGAVSLEGKMSPGDIHLQANAMVTATENLVIAASTRVGTTYIHNAAHEPHVIDLVKMLRSAGVDITLSHDHIITVRGVAKLPDHVEWTITSDYLESGTFAVIGALASESYIDITHARIADLNRFLGRMSAAGVRWEDRGDDILRVYRSESLKAIDLQTNVFPGVPSDLQSPIAILLSQAEGVSRIHEVLFENRFSYLGEVEKMKGHVVVMNPHEALIFGKTPLKGTTVSSWDLRAGAAMVIAGLIASGETYVTNVEYIHRGYEDIVGKITRLGGKIETVTLS